MMVCMKNCHACTLQEGVMNKSLCATLLLPAMIERMSARLSQLEAKLQPSVNEIAAHDEADKIAPQIKKLIKSLKDENAES